MFTSNSTVVSTSIDQFLQLPNTQQATLIKQLDKDARNHFQQQLRDHVIQKHSE